MDGAFREPQLGPGAGDRRRRGVHGGTADRYFRAFDANTGAELWKQRTNSGVTGVPSSYAVDGKQYVAVLAGWGVDAERQQDSFRILGRTDEHVPQGGVLWVFGL